MLCSSLPHEALRFPIIIRDPRTWIYVEGYVIVQNPWDVVGSRWSLQCSMSGKEELLWTEYINCNSNAKWSLNNMFRLSRSPSGFLVTWCFSLFLYSINMAVDCLLGVRSVVLWSLKQHVSTKQVIFRLFPWRIWFSWIVGSIYVAGFSLM